jgi:hypothetical protein
VASAGRISTGDTDSIAGRGPDPCPPSGLPRRRRAADEAIAALGEAGRLWFLWVLPDTPADVIRIAADAGAVEWAGREPWMEARVADLPEPVVPPGVTIEEVADEAGYRLWAATMREIYRTLGFEERGWVSRRLGGR